MENTEIIEELKEIKKDIKNERQKQALDSAINIIKDTSENNQYAYWNIRYDSLGLFDGYTCSNCDIYTQTNKPSRCPNCKAFMKN